MATPSHEEPRGYHRLADLMGHYSEAAIFRRFGALNMLNLLSLQAELVDLQVQFRDVWIEDETSSDNSEKLFSTHFRTLRKSEDSHHLKMLIEIRQKLQEYSMFAPPHCVTLEATSDDHRRGLITGSASAAPVLTRRRRFTVPPSMARRVWGGRELSERKRKVYLGSS